LTIISPILCFSQAQERKDPEGNIEQIFEYSDQTSFSESQIEYIEFRKNNKLNLWNAPVSELTQFPNFDLISSKKILDYVKENPNTSIAKLSKELDLTGNQIVILEYCTYISEVIVPSYFELYSRNKTNLTSDKIYGFEENKYKGSQFDYSSRTYISYNSFDAGIILDKDAGEIRSVDFISGHLKYEKNNLKILAGDFYYELGMGNILWRDFPESKGSDVISPAMRFGNGLKPYRSTIDNSFFRGGAIDYTFKIGNSNIKFGLFASSANRSGTFDSVNNIISSVYTMGLYRTDTELKKRYILNEKALSGNIIYENNFFLSGIGVLSLNYEFPIQSSSASAFLGKSGLLKTHFTRYFIPDFTIGYEVSLDANDNLGGKIASIIDFGDLEISSHFRYFSENFRSPFGSIFGEYSYPANEVGFYFGAFYKGIKGIRFYNYVDFFKSLGRTYYIDGIVSGFALFNQTEIQLSKRLDFITRIKYDNKTDEKNNGSNDITFQKQRIFWRNEIQFGISKTLRSRIRLEACYIDFADIVPSETGLAGFFELHYQIKNLEVFARTSLFSTKSYESAVWQYEYFIPGSLSTFPAYLDGSRIVLGAKTKIYDVFRVQLLYTNTSKNNIEFLSSGNDKVLSNSTNNLILQVELLIR
jgi:hypothetical protein